MRVKGALTTTRSDLRGPVLPPQPASSRCGEEERQEASHGGAHCRAPSPKYAVRTRSSAATSAGVPSAITPPASSTITRSASSLTTDEVVLDDHERPALVAQRRSRLVDPADFGGGGVRPSARRRAGPPRRSPPLLPASAGAASAGGHRSRAAEPAASPNRASSGTRPPRRTPRPRAAPAASRERPDEAVALAPSGGSDEHVLERRQRREHRGRLERARDAAGDRDPALVGRGRSREQTEHRRLARPVRADDGRDRARLEPRARRRRPRRALRSASRGRTPTALPANVSGRTRSGSASMGARRADEPVPAERDDAEEQDRGEQRV